jgi:hypothetical protein
MREPREPREPRDGRERHTPQFLQRSAAAAAPRATTVEADDEFEDD